MFDCSSCNKLKARRWLRRTAVGKTGSIRGTNVGLRQIKREDTPLSDGAAKLDFTAQETGQLAAYCKAESSAAVFAAGSGVGLLKRLENNSLFLWRDTNSAVGNFKRDDRRGAAQNWMIFAPATVGDRYR